MTSAVTLAPGLFDVELPPAPYPGLRPFELYEWPIFFGRETMTGEATRRLLDQNLLVVHGDSGCGKSSLIQAGVLVQLEQRHARGAQRWHTCTMLPREAPLRRLAQSLATLKEPDPSPDLVRQIRRVLNSGRAAAAKLEDLLCTDPTDRICILIDQFEELFRFAKETSADEARLFVDVLVGLLEEAERRRESETGRQRLYAILTLRSEFLGACARYSGLVEAVNKTQYLLPRMERPALLRAIHEPALRCDGEVSRELAARLIADAGSEQDQLSLIQHGLMLLWQQKVGQPSTKPGDQAEGAGLAEAPGLYRQDPDRAWTLDLSDYRQSGGLAQLLSDHADRVMQEVAPDEARQGMVEHMFRALTGINAEGHAIRRPQTVAQLRAVTNADPAILDAIMKGFRAEGVSFLSPYGDDALDPEQQIDISHEALIRCWQRVTNPEDSWLQREFRDGLIWKTLLVQAGKGETLSAAATADREEWLRRLPSEAWAERYGGGWGEVEGLLERSREAARKAVDREREREQIERERKQAQRVLEAAERAAKSEEARREEAERATKAEEARREGAERSRKRLRWLSVGLAGLALAAIVAGRIAFQKSEEARAQTRTDLERPP